jgi:hypothetical protein
MRWIAIGVLALAAAAPRAVGAQSSPCALHGPDAVSLKADACLACHGKGGSATQIRFAHPVDVDYAAVRGARPSDLRPLAEVTRRGVVLSAGQVRCATCHDGRSPWAHYIALPPGAPASAAASPALPDGAHGQPEPGAEVSPKPLCLACHATD